MKNNKRNQNRQLTANPFRGTLGKLFDEGVWQPFSDWESDLAWQTNFPQVDIKEKKNEIEVIANVPGIDEKDINIEVEDNYLKISGKQQREKIEEEENVYREERTYGEFRREFTLPCTVDSSKVKANMKDGVLRINLPKSESAKARRIKIDKE